MPAAGAAGQGERSEVCHERGAQRRREDGAAVTLPAPSNDASAVSDRHAAVSVANRRPSEARKERSEWRREGYPPEGSRPRSGLGRVARSRSDAPSLLVRIPAPVSIIGTIGFMFTGATTTGTTTITIGVVTGSRRTLSSWSATR